MPVGSGIGDDESLVCVGSQTDKTVFCLGIGLLSVTAAVCKSLVQLTVFRWLLLSVGFGGERGGGWRERESAPAVHCVLSAECVCCYFRQLWRERERECTCCSWRLSAGCVCVCCYFRQLWRERGEKEREKSAHVLFLASECRLCVCCYFRQLWAQQSQPREGGGACTFCRCYR